MARWTNAEIETLIQLATRENNFSAAQIGKILSKTRGSVCSQIHRTNKKLPEGHKLHLSEGKAGYQVSGFRNRSQSGVKKSTIEKEAVLTSFDPDSLVSPWRITLQRMSARMPASALPDLRMDKYEAAQTLVALFEATSLTIPGMPTCIQKANGHACGLAVDDAEIRCAFHKAVGRFAVLDLTADDIYKGSPLLETELKPLAEAKKRSKQRILQHA